MFKKLFRSKTPTEKGHGNCDPFTTPHTETHKVNAYCTEHVVCFVKDVDHSSCVHSTHMRNFQYNAYCFEHSVYFIKED